MTKAMISFFCLFFSLLIASLSGEVIHYEDHLIHSVTINIHTQEGTVDSRPILARLGTKSKSYFSQSTFDEDLKTLAKDYDRVEPKIETMDDQVNVIIDVWPKPLIRSIIWEGNNGVDTRTLQSELGIGIYSTYDKQAFNEAFHKIRAFYLKKGYFEAEIDYQVELDSDKNQVKITVEINEGRSGRIQQIEFINFSEKEECHVLKLMMTQRYIPLMSWFNNEGTYNDDFIQQDRLVITHYLQNEGYSDAQVSIEVEECGDCNNRIRVIITADRGERYYFGEVSFEGNQILCDEKIERLFKIRPGMPFGLEKIRSTIEILNDAYGSIGYIDALVDFEPELVEGEHKYNVRIKIEEGEEFRVGLVKVFGNITTQTRVILHETLMVPGEVFNTLKLKATETRLINIGYFKNVNAYIVKGTESSLGGNYRDVYIEVEETTTGNFSGFLGYSTSEEIFGGINITENNFNSRGIAAAWKHGAMHLRGGGEYLHLSLQVGQKSRTYALSWTKPYFMDTPWSIGFDLSKSTTSYISDDYDLDTASLVLRGTYNIHSFLRWGVQYRLTNGVVHADKDNKELRKESHIHGLISAIGTSLAYDSTNSPVKPSKGFRSRLLLELAGVGGDHTFFSAGYYNSYYYPVGSRTVMKYRADIRFIQPLGKTKARTLPLDERMFLGGDFAVRGFRPYKLGPHFEDSRIPSGGISMQLYSVEMNRRIRKDFEVFAFLDAGHLSNGTWEFGRLSVAVGYGARFKVLESIPPMTVGMGYPLNPQNRSQVKKFFISFGGNF